MPSNISVWRLTPSAAPEDSRWLDHRPVAALYVAAETPASARMVAAHADVPRAQGKVGNESGHAHSRFIDEKLYRVDAASEEECRSLPSLPDQAQVIGELRQDGSIAPW